MGSIHELRQYLLLGLIMTNKIDQSRRTTIYKSSQMMRDEVANTKKLASWV